MKRIIISLLFALALVACGHTESELQEAYDKGRESGFNQGYSEGFEKGKDEGYKEGYDACLQRTSWDD